MARLEDLRRGDVGTVGTEPLAFGDEAGYDLTICSPLDTPQGLGRGYFVSGGLDAR